MRISQAGVVLYGAAGVLAFRDTSPFMYFSTTGLTLTSPQITTSSSLISSIESQLLDSGSQPAGSCPVHTYIIAVQPGISALDLSSKDVTLNLQGWLSAKEKTYKSKASVAEVIGDKNPQDLIQLVASRCSRMPMCVDFQSAQALSSKYTKEEPRLIVIDMPKLPVGPSRVAALRENDIQLANVVKHFSKQGFSLFVTGTPPSPADLHATHEQLEYEMDESQSALHVELKRELSAHKRAENVTLPDGPLFERYQYFTPGIFMGLVTFLLLFVIGYTGVSALGSLQVSYAAFDKENGPQAQRNKA